MTRLIRVRSVLPLSAPQVEVVFTNGETRRLDITAYIAHGPIFAPVRNDPTFFAQVTVDGGTIVWPNGADIDPDVLYAEGMPTYRSDRHRWRCRIKGESVPVCPVAQHRLAPDAPSRGDFGGWRVHRPRLTLAVGRRNKAH